MRSLTLARAAGAGFLLAAIALFILYLIPSNHYYVFLPDRAHPLEPLVRISGEHATASRGGVYFVDVRFRKARLLEDLLGRPLARGATLQPIRDVLGSATEKQQQRLDVNAMQESQKIAAAVALKRLGYHVRIRPPSVVIRGVLRKAPAGRVLRPGDRLLAVDRRPVHSLCGLHKLIASHRPGDRLRTTCSRSAPSSRRRSARARRVWTSSSSRRGRTHAPREGMRTDCESSLCRAFHRRCTHWQRCPRSIQQPPERPVSESRAKCVKFQNRHLDLSGDRSMIVPFKSGGHT